MLKKGAIIVCISAFFSCTGGPGKEMRKNYFSVDSSLPSVKCARAFIISEQSTFNEYGVYLEFTEPVSFPERGVYVYPVTGDVKNGHNSRYSIPAEIDEFELFPDSMRVFEKVKLAKNAWYYVEVLTSVRDIAGNPLDGSAGIKDCSASADLITGEPDGVNVFDIHRIDEDYYKKPVTYESLAFPSGTPVTKPVTLVSEMRPFVSMLSINGFEVPGALLYDGSNVSYFSAYGVGVTAGENPVFTVHISVPSGSSLKNFSAAIESSGKRVDVLYMNANGTWSQEPAYLESPGGVTLVIKPVGSLSRGSLYTLVLNSGGSASDEYGVKFTDRRFDLDDIFLVKFSVPEAKGLLRLHTLIPDISSFYTTGKFAYLGFLTPDNASSPFGDSDLIDKSTVFGSTTGVRKVLDSVHTLPDGRAVPQTLLQFDASVTQTACAGVGIMDEEGNMLDANADGVVEPGERICVSDILNLIAFFPEVTLYDPFREPDDTVQMAFVYPAYTSSTVYSTPSGDVDFVKFNAEDSLYLAGVLFPSCVSDALSGTNPPPLTFSVDVFSSFNAPVTEYTSSLTCAPLMLTFPVEVGKSYFLKLSCTGEGCNRHYTFMLQPLSGNLMLSPDVSRMGEELWHGSAFISSDQASLTIVLPDEAGRFYIFGVLGKGSINSISPPPSASLKMCDPPPGITLCAEVVKTNEDAREIRFDVLPDGGVAYGAFFVIKP